MRWEHIHRRDRSNRVSQPCDLTCRSSLHSKRGGPRNSANLLRSADDYRLDGQRNEGNRCRYRPDPQVTCSAAPGKVPMGPEV